MTVVFAVVTRTFNEDKLIISQRKIMYHMARSPPAMHANLMPPNAARRRRAARGPRDATTRSTSRNFKLLRIATTTMHDRPWSVVAADRE